MATDSTTGTQQDLNAEVRRDVSEDEVLEAARKATRKAAQTHLDAGHSIPTARNGRLVWLHPDGSIRDEP